MCIKYYIIPFHTVCHSILFSFQVFICGLSFATFAVALTNPQGRLIPSFTLVLTMITFKYTVNQSLPKISYLTYLVSYLLVWNSQMWQVASVLMPFHIGWRRFYDEPWSANIDKFTGCVSTTIIIRNFTIMSAHYDHDLSRQIPTIFIVGKLAHPYLCAKGSQGSPIWLPAHHGITFQIALQMCITFSSQECTLNLLMVLTNPRIASLLQYCTGHIYFIEIIWPSIVHISS